MRNKGRKFCWTDEAPVENIKCELCEAPFLDMPTEKFFKGWIRTHQW